MTKLRVASYYDPEMSGRNDGAPLYVTNVFNRDYPDINFVHLAPKASAKDHGTFDFHLWIDWGEDCWPESEAAHFVCPKPNFYWVSDLHCSEASFKYRVEKAKQFDMIGCYHRQFVEPIKAAVGHDRVYWLPVAADPQAYPYGQAAKKYDVGFIGNLCNEERVAALDKMFRAFPTSFWAKRVFEQAAEAYQEMKICFNHALKEDINMRNAEVTCCGGFLLTPDLRSQGLGELWEVGKEIVVYQDLDEAIQLAKHYVACDDEREVIAAAGAARTHRDHTYKRRVEQMMAWATTAKLWPGVPA